MDARRWTIVAAVVLLACAVTAAAAEERAIPRSGVQMPELTPEEQAVVDQAQDLRKQIEINRLELRLLELKDAPEQDIAERAEQGYRLQGRLHALRVKYRDVLAKVWQHGGRRAWRHGRARGDRFAGGGPGMRAHRGQGMHGPGPGMGRGGHGVGRGGRNMGRGGRGMGLQQGMGRRMGPGMHRGMGFGPDAGVGLEMEPGMGPAAGLEPGMRHSMWHDKDVWEYLEPAAPDVETEEKLSG